MSNKRQDIALVRLSALGDCVLALPVVRAILGQLENAHIHWVIGKGAHQLLKDCQHPRLHFHPIDKPRNLADYRAIKKQFSHLNFEVLLAMQASTRANLIYPLLKAKRKIGFDSTRARELQWLFTNEKIVFKDNHLHDSFAQFAQKLGVNPESINSDKSLWQIEIDSKQRQQFAQQLQLPKKFIAINPAASKKQRSWSIQKYLELIVYLQKKYQANIILTGGNASFELEIAEQLVCHPRLADSNTQLIDLVGKTNLQQLAFVLQEAQILIAPDTGPLHIANAMGTKVVGLYATAPSKLSGPYFSQQHCVDQFQQAVSIYLKGKSKNKDSSNLAWKTRVHHKDAMDLISLEHVIEKVDALLMQGV